MLAVLQARMSSSRLPGKVLRPILGRPMMALQIERLRRARRLTGLVVATSTQPEDDAIEACCASVGAACYRGALNDVLSRFVGALIAAGEPKTFLRLTADCPLADWRLVDQCIAAHEDSGATLTYTSENWTYPKGLDVEVVETAALTEAAARARDSYEREHVTPYIYRHPERFTLNSLTRDPPLRYRWTVDTPEDFAFAAAVYGDLYPTNPAFTSEDILAWQAEHPERVLAHEPG
jgi:spore coat polysaccharide biosynthesis protein SpsF